MKITKDNREQEEEYCKMCFERGGVKQTSCNSCLNDEMTATRKQLTTPKEPIEYEEIDNLKKLLEENKKSFKEALYRQKKANKMLHAEIDRLKLTRNT